MLAMKVLSSVTYYNGTPHFAKVGQKNCNFSIHSVDKQLQIAYTVLIEHVRLLQ